MQPNDIIPCVNCAFALLNAMEEEDDGALSIGSATIIAVWKDAFGEPPSTLDAMLIGTTVADIFENAVCEIEVVLDLAHAIAHIRGVEASSTEKDDASAMH